LQHQLLSPDHRIACSARDFWGQTHGLPSEFAGDRVGEVKVNPDEGVALGVSGLLIQACNGLKWRLVTASSERRLLTRIRGSVIDETEG
jgi:hypothetical protein